MARHFRARGRCNSSIRAGLAVASLCLISAAGARAAEVLYVGNDNTPGGVNQYTLPLTASSTANFTTASNNVVAVGVDQNANVAVGDNAGNLKVFAPPLSGASVPYASFKNGVASNNGQLAFTNTSQLWAATVSNRVNAFTPPFTNATTPSAFVTDPGMVSDIGTAIDGAQNLYISNAGTGNAAACAGTSQPGGGCGSNLYVYAPPYSGAPIITPNVINFPYVSASTAYRKIALSSTQLFAASVANAPGRVDVYNLPITAASTPAFALTTGVNTPEGLAVDSAGNLYVGNLSDATVSVFNPPITASSVPSLIFKVSTGAFAIFGIAVGPVPSSTLSVSLAGTGAGLVTSSPAGITCSASINQCSTSLANGTLVTLTASASAGSSFTGWSGGGCSGTAPCTFALNANTTVTANFALIPSYTLSVAPAGTGSGTVTSFPSGINCQGTCTASFQSGTQVTLAADASGGSTFAGWSGGGCSGILSCTVTLSAATAVTATFVLNTTSNVTLVAAVLPNSRSVQVGNAATAFATMINTGSAAATTCTISPATSIPANFLFQTTSATTNAVTGTANTPANIPAGASQSFVIALTPTAAFAPTEVPFTFTCADASPAASIVGVNTLNLSGSTSPVPDIVALSASGDPGYVDIPGATGTGSFAVATVNLGAGAPITVTADTGTANLPVTLTLCQTNPVSGACLATPAASATTTINTNAVPTFAVFAAGSASVPNLPGVNRVFVRFKDAGGVLRGETSVAVRTQ
jgi:hypothetical protein